MASIESLGALQADNGQIAKFVDPDGRDADFWYLGCIDATLWWVIAADHLRRLAPACPTRAAARLRPSTSRSQRRKRTVWPGVVTSATQLMSWRPSASSALRIG